MKNSDDHNPKKNAEGYPDPTAYEALKNIDADDQKFHNLLRTIKGVCEIAGFKIQGRVVLMDKETGRVWR